MFQDHTQVRAKKKVTYSQTEVSKSMRSLVPDHESPSFKMASTLSRPKSKSTNIYQSYAKTSP